ncbi:UDP-N-acetylmuramate--L-alanine ligase [Thermodesulfovibrionales bacterium]|nr:UDP-N-acetylmuramate--L-alanine ligase [Thermodesulfovibrionales bacterium]MCL0033481.1 UDP-N-acetylmuramate--L-alanine ligase [Thermodesulfovibrionales bacterium]MCL0033948.1 UDP-N-acetylmuramate--L-alanine ligase [Thermodesulfovibrionales bacterium]MCL0039966.1 UDP-N-acetylmuramate--L-alanine ligase [Thermodesulfovibrionales bacterium]MCL0061385.1 UDP-N-acetylmuramate--L-alanine ligase [Thermodesulfovibrionales bacterium]
MFNQYKIIHFVGIGGVGMSGIAEVLHNLKYEVTGSDINESETTIRLKCLGVKIFIGHDARNVDHAHVIVVSSAVPSDNPEVAEAKRRSIPIIPRAEMLAELGRLKYGILIAGSHGKTTTTSLIANLLGEGGLDPTVIIGGRLKSMGSNAKLGNGDFLAAEADESDGSFLKLNPTIAVITNIDKEHMDFFKGIEMLKSAFLSFINKLPFYGVAIICREDEQTRSIIPLIQRKVLTYGLSDKADIYATGIRYQGDKMSFEVIFKGGSLGIFSLPLLGVHNVLNSLSVIAVGLELQIPIETVSKTLSNFGGICRRFEFKGEEGGIKVFDDYGHHPTEIRATLEAVKGSLNGQRVVALFQPHRYTRTMDLIDEFSASFDKADRLFLMEIYPAGEQPIDGINSENLSKRIKGATLKEVSFIPDRGEMAEQIISELKSGDVFITLGAGDVYKVGEEILKRLGNYSGSRFRGSQLKSDEKGGRMKRAKQVPVNLEP